eukprot:3270-Heterococcus_DN1.PRE.1
MCSTADTTSAAANLPPPAPVDDIDTELQLSLAQLQDTAATMSTPRARLEAHVAMADNIACADAPLDHSELSSLGLGLQPFVFEGSAIADKDALEPELLQPSLRAHTASHEKIMSQELCADMEWHQFQHICSDTQGALAEMNQTLGATCIPCEKCTMLAGLQEWRKQRDRQAAELKQQQLDLGNVSAVTDTESSEA